MTRAIVLAGVWMFGSLGAFGAAGAPAWVDWNAMLPEVQRAVRQQFPQEAERALHPPSILTTADLTGTGGRDALVNLGSGGYTEELTVMRMEGDTPVAARFRGRDDKISTMVFMAGLSDNKGTAIELIPNDHAVFSAHWTVKAQKVKGCNGEVYQWNAESKNFGFDKKLSKAKTREFCHKIEAESPR